MHREFFWAAIYEIGRHKILSNGLRTREEPVSHTFVDYHHSWRTSYVVFIEIASAEKRRTKSGKIARRNKIHIGVGIVTDRPPALFQMEISAPHISANRRNQRLARRGCSWK